MPGSTAGAVQEEEVQDVASYNNQVVMGSTSRPKQDLTRTSFHHEKDQGKFLFYFA